MRSRLVTLVALAAGGLGPLTAIADPAPTPQATEATSAVAEESYRDVLPDSATALAVGRLLMHRYFARQVLREYARGHKLVAEMNGGAWDVYYDQTADDPPPTRTRPGEIGVITVTAGGGPMLEIERHDGRVVYIGVEK
jgi:hypothetical protein